MKLLPAARASTVERIPYTAHVSATVVKTLFGDYVQVMRLGGASFECADDEQLNTWHERLNVLWRNIASPQVSLWTHIIRRREVLGSHGRLRGLRRCAREEVPRKTRRPEAHGE